MCLTNEGNHIYIHTHTSVELTFVCQELERESTIAGHFPPNSRVTGVRCLAAADITSRPTRALPRISFNI
jgi:hypothetical protein